jgi:hypothetical protein
MGVLGPPEDLEGEGEGEEAGLATPADGTSGTGR